MISYPIKKPPFYPIGWLREALVFCQIKAERFVGLNAVFLLETIDAAASIQELLLTRVERVALGTNLYAKARFNRTSLEGISASASCCNDVVCRMNSLFHLVHLFLP